MTTKKMTKRDHFNALLAMPDVANDPEAVEFINHEIELLNRKNSSGERKPTKEQEEAAVMRERIAQGMEPNHIYSVSEIAKTVLQADISTQKVTPMLTQLVKDGICVRLTEKGRSYYKLAD